MKWIKTFEELDPDVFRRASKIADYYNKTDKAAALSDWADKQQFGFYNLHFSNNSGNILKNGSFTDPELIGIYTGNKLTQERNLLHYNNRNRQDELYNNLIRDWKNGTDELKLFFEFGFRPTKETVNAKYTHSHFKSPKRGTAFTNGNAYSSYINGGKVPAFSLCLEFSEWNDGIEEWDAEAKWEIEQRGEVFEPSDIYQFFEFTKCFHTYLMGPSCEFYGIFSDRQSAQKFKNWLLTIIDDKIKDAIMDLLTIVSGEVSDIENSMRSLSGIRIHGLYDDNTSDINIQTIGDRKWYRKKL